MTETETKKRPKRFLKFILILIFVIMGLLAALPTILSTDAARTYALQRASDDLGLQLDISKWKIHWKDGVSADTISFVEPELGLDVQIDSVQLNSALLELIKSGKAASEAGDDVSAILSALDGTYRIQNARVSSTGDNADTMALIERLDVDLSKEGNQNVLSTRVSTVNDGSLNLDGTITPGSSPQALSANLVLNAAHIDLAPYRALMASDTNLPSWGGILNGTIKANISGPKTMQSTGSLTLTNLTLAGGMLGTDTPHLPRVDLNYSTALDGDILNVRGFEFNSALLQASLSSELQIGANTLPRNATVSATLKLSELASQLPATLKLKDGMHVTDGSLSLKGAMVSSDLGQSIKASLATKDISATKDNKTYRLSKPLNAQLKARLSDEGVQVENLTLESSFATLSGSGNMDQMSIQLKADIAQALSEARTFSDLGPLDATGSVYLTTKLTTDATKKRQIASSLHTSDIKIHSANNQTIKIGGLQGNLSSGLRLSPENTPLSLDNLAFQLTNDTLTASLMANSLVLPTDTHAASLTAATLKADVNIASLMALSAGAASPTLIMGKATLQTPFSLTGSTITAPKLSITTTPLSLVESNTITVLTKQPSSLTGAIAATDTQVSFKQMLLKTEHGTLAFDGSISDLEKTGRLALAGNLKMDYAHLAELLKTFTGYAVTMRGKESADFSLSMAAFDDDPAKTAVAQTSLKIDHVSYQGVELDNVTIPVSVQGGIARAKVDAALNGGRLSITPTLHLTGEQMLSIPNNSTVFTNVTLTSKLLNESLVSIHPLLKDCAVTRGKIHLDIDRFQQSISDSTKPPVLAGTLRFEDTVLRPGGTIGRILSGVKLDMRDIEVASKDLHFEIRKDRLHTSPLIFSTGNTTITFAGSVSLDGQLDYTVAIPITKNMVGSGSTYEKLKDEVITLPLRGTTGSEIFDTKAFLKELARLVAKAEYGDKIEKEADRLKEKLGIDSDALKKQLDKGLKDLFKR